jgi:murein DD-endopeptidase MepM/ murein hydrolase activator NlpD
VKSAILVILLLVIVSPLVWIFARSTTPVVDVDSGLVTIGQATPVSVHVHDKRGITKMSAYIEQNGQRFPVAEDGEPTTRAERSWSFTAGVKNVPQLKDGKAQLIVEAKSNDTLGRTGRASREVTVVTRPPSVSVDSEQHYLYLGMADLATFNVSGNFTAAGVRVGDQTYRAWPMPDGKPGMFSLFAYAWNAPQGTVPQVYAANGVGNDVMSPIEFQFPKKEQPRYTMHQLNIDDRFVQKVVNELDPNGAGDMVERFVRINNEMRKANNKTLSDLRFKTEQKFLWTQPFARQSNAATEAHFADERHYMYHGKEIDKQTHLGYDLAVTQHVGVESSNDGKVVYAAPLGIYGNCIVVDHGYGLQTIYGHLSRIDVKEGDMVKRGQVMGLSGMTGMAGGDHIHFSMQLDGVQIDPKEWWDAHWIKDHIAKRVDLPGFHE